MDSFFEQVYALVRAVPEGRVVSYGQVAAMLGRPRAARMVGRAMRCSPDKVQWQRVVMAAGWTWKIAAGSPIASPIDVFRAKCYNFMVSKPLTGRRGAGWRFSRIMR